MNEPARPLVRVQNRDRLIKNKPVNNEDLKNALEKYAKSKLPTRLCQKTECLFAPVNAEASEVISKSQDIKPKLLDDEILMNYTINSIVA